MREGGGDGLGEEGGGGEYITYVLFFLQYLQKFFSSFFVFIKLLEGKGRRLVTVPLPKDLSTLCTLIHNMT